MAIYSDEKRPLLASLIKYLLFLNVLFFIVLAAFWIFRAGPEEGLRYTGTYATILIGLNILAFLIYEQLYRPEDDGLRKLAEVLGSLQVLCSVLSLLIVIGTIALAISPGLSGVLPIIGGSQPVAAVPTTPAGSTVSPTAAPTLIEPTACYQTAKGCVPIPPSPTVPPLGTPVAKNDPVVGSFIFEKAQFDPKVNYFSRAGNFEYNYLSVPLDHSPDVKWTFRDDGVVLFYDTTNGNLMRIGSWSKTDLGNNKAEYKIKRGNYDYRGAFENSKFRITSPDFWNMTRVS